MSQKSMDSTEIVPARDGEEFMVRVNGGDWIVAWHPASKAPEGTPHGATAICLTADGGLVLIGNDGKRWGLPGGRPEKEESWVQTLHRELLEEACAKVVRARLLGFTRGRCVAGPEEGLGLVRSLWRCEAELAPWPASLVFAQRPVIPAQRWAY